MMKCIDKHVWEGVFPVAERVGKQIVSLPMFYAMNEVNIERTCTAMREVLLVSPILVGRQGQPHE